MKRMLALLLTLSVLLCGCGAQAGSAADKAQTPAVAETQAAETTEPTTEPTTVPTEPEVYYNPLNGEILDEPFTGRIFANTISNVQHAIPHVGVNQADILMEMYVNHSVVRCLALYTDIEDVEAMGSTRSTRPIFNDIAQHYDLILAHAGGMNEVLRDATSRGVVHYNVDSLMNQGDPLMKGTAYRDKIYHRQWEDSLFTIGSGFKAWVESQEVPMTLERDYGLVFTDDGTPDDGEDAQEISITLTFNKSKKETIMKYDETTGKYAFWQYGKMMADQITDEPEQFQNVIVMFANITMNNTLEHPGIFQQADFNAGGLGYYANGGKLIPILWACDGDDQPFRFMTNDAQPLELGQGNTYIAICTPESPVTWEAADQTAQ